jgi:hypothetical protein
MLKDHQRLLEFLKSELAAIEHGGYRRSERQPWRARLAFEDSPCCPNYGDNQRRIPCAECVLMQFVPPDRRNEKVPCRFIPLDAKGVTIDSLYRCGTQDELETAMAKWLRKTIHRIEQEVAEEQAGLRVAAPNV